MTNYFCNKISFARSCRARCFMTELCCILGKFRASLRINDSRPALYTHPQALSQRCVSVLNELLLLARSVRAKHINYPSVHVNLARNWPALKFVRTNDRPLSNHPRRAGVKNVLSRARDCTDGNRFNGGIFIVKDRVAGNLCGFIFEKWKPRALEFAN